MRAPRVVLTLLATAALSGCEPGTEPVSPDPTIQPRLDGGGWVGGGGKTEDTDSVTVSSTAPDSTAL